MILIIQTDVLRALKKMLSLLIFTVYLANFTKKCHNIKQERAAYSYHNLFTNLKPNTMKTRCKGNIIFYFHKHFIMIFLFDKKFFIKFFKSNVQFQFIHLCRAEETKQRTLDGLLNQIGNHLLIELSCSSHSLYLRAGRLWSDIGIQSRTYQ